MQHAVYALFRFLFKRTACWHGERIKHMPTPIHSHRVVNHKPTLPPWECAHCRFIWYGWRSANENVFPPTLILCPDCRWELDTYLYRYHNKLIESQENIQALHTLSLTWSIKKIKCTRTYGKSVRKWMKSAIDQGMVETNSDNWYSISSQNNIAVDVRIIQREKIPA